MKMHVRFTVLAVFLLFTTPFFAHAQAVTCSEAPDSLPGESSQQRKDRLTAVYNACNAEYQAAQDQLTAAQAKSSSLTNDIAVLDAKIKAAELQIKAKNLLIQTLSNNITQKQAHIDDLESRIDSGKATLAAIMRKTNEVDAYSFPEVALSQTSVAGFFQDLDTFQSVQESLKTVFEQLRTDQASTTAEKDALEVRQNTEMDARYIIQQQQKNIETDKKTQKQLLALSKDNEKAYSSLAAQKASQAAKIRAALFPLAGGVKIPFGQALTYAQAASAKTGVRPAFLLAILTNESALGANVGQCYISNLSTGDGINIKTGSFSPNVMKPTRDIQPFLEITKSLGFDPMKTVVSCQQASVGGWGGAMGPAQFIPSTWALFTDRLRGALGIADEPNPWNPAHAFMASALYLDDLGAGNGGYTAERNAACKYYSGSSCTKSRAIAGYGTNAINQANIIQQNINQL